MHAYLVRARDLFEGIGEIMRCISVQVTGLKLNSSSGEKAADVEKGLHNLMLSFELFANGSAM